LIVYPRLIREIEETWRAAKAAERVAANVPVPDVKMETASLAEPTRDDPDNTGDRRSDG